MFTMSIVATCCGQTHRTPDQDLDGFGQRIRVPGLF